MTYIKSIPISIYKNWRSYKDWHASDYQTFHSYLREKYAECIISVEYTDNMHGWNCMDRLITFHSAEHYTWFLLQQ